MKAWSEFYDSLLPDLPGCTPTMANVALRHAAREFCSKTLAWNEWRGPQDTSATSIEYDFDVASTEDVVKLLGATLAGNDLLVLAQNDLPLDWTTAPGCRSGIVTIDRRSFFVLPQRDAGLAIRTWIALQPSKKGLGVPDALFAQYEEDICAGAKARLMLSPKKPYSDTGLAGVHRLDFDQRIARATRAVEKSFSRVPRRVVAHYF
ncbi:hypothetical protein D9M73_70880 [compost metagenome]